MNGPDRAARRSSDSDAAPGPGVKPMPLPVPRLPDPGFLGTLDQRWMTRAACAGRTDLPWTEDAHRVEAELRDVMAAVCAGCPVRRECQRFARSARATAGFWAGRYRGGAYTGDRLDHLADLDDVELATHYAESAEATRRVHRKALAS